MLSLMDHHSWLAYVLDLFANLPKLNSFFCIMRKEELFRWKCPALCRSTYDCTFTARASQLSSSNAAPAKHLPVHQTH